MSCIAIIKKGTRKNEVCGTSVKTDSDTCYRHSEKRREFERERIRTEEYKEKKKISNRKNKQLNWDLELLMNCRKNDKEKNREFNLDREFVKLMLEDQLGNCFICGCTLLLTNGNKSKQQASIDRVDNKIGHKCGNVVLTCWGCNHAKGNRSFDTVVFPCNFEDILKP